MTTQGPGIQAQNQEENERQKQFNEKQNEMRRLQQEWLRRKNLLRSVDKFQVLSQRDKQQQNAGFESSLIGSVNRTFAYDRLALAIAACLDLIGTILKLGYCPTYNNLNKLYKDVKKRERAINSNLKPGEKPVSLTIDIENIEQESQTKKLFPITWEGDDVTVHFDQEPLTAEDVAKLSNVDKMLLITANGYMCKPPLELAHRFEFSNYVSNIMGVNDKLNVLQSVMAQKNQLIPKMQSGREPLAQSGKDFHAGDAQMLGMC